VWGQGASLAGSISLLACGSAPAGTTTNNTTAVETGSGDGDGDGDGDGAPTGDGDGTPTGDGDGAPPGDGDGDPTGDGDGEPGDGDPTGGLKFDTIPPDWGSGLGECIQDIDIVFVMDVSTTMGPFFDKLELEIGGVQAAIDLYDLPSPAHYGLVVFVDDYTVVNGGMPYTDVNQLAADFAFWNNFTASNQQTMGGNSNFTWTENSIDALYAAADEFQWRPKGTTLRMIVHTTDDTFWDGPTVGNNVNIQHGYAETVALLQSNEIWTFAFADMLGGPSGNLDVSMGWFTPYMGMAPIPEQTGGTATYIVDVLNGQVSIADTISTSIMDSYCEEYPAG
jgi:hypothetical protein